LKLKARQGQKQRAAAAGAGCRYKHKLKPPAKQRGSARDTALGASTKAKLGLLLFLFPLSSFLLSSRSPHIPQLLSLCVLPVYRLLETEEERRGEEYTRYRSPVVHHLPPVLLATTTTTTTTTKMKSIHCLLLALLPAALAAPAPAPVQAAAAPHPMITARASLTDRTPTRVQERDIISSIAGLGTYLSSVLGTFPSYVASGVPNFFQDFPTGAAVESSLGISDSDLAATPTQVLNIP
jgi:hypothetical protein